MDYSSSLKAHLENDDFLNALDQLKLKNDLLDSIKKSNLSITNNICCSNNSFLFVYFEQAALFLAISLNKLCKATEERPFIECIQKLNINAPPIGQFKKCLINKNGTYILLVYDKSLMAIELPPKWGKYDQYDGGKANIICKSIKFKLSLKVDVIDAIWHRKHNNDCIVSLTSDNNIKFFSIKSPSIVLKEFHLINNYSSLDVDENEAKLKSSKFLSIEMGSVFEHNEKQAHSIFLLKSNGQVECLVEYEGNRRFEYLGPLTLVPYVMDHEGQQVLDFICLPTQPTCLVILLTSGIINHCIFMPNTKYSLFESGNLNDLPDSVAGEAILFIYESIKLNENNDHASIKFLKDDSNSCRYFVYHSTGMHSIYLQWLESLQTLYQNQKNLDMSVFDESQLCEVNHIINTKPVVDLPSESFLIGSTILTEFFVSKPILAGFTNQFKFVLKSIDNSNLINELKSQESKEESQDDMFTSYITDLLKREANMPIIKSDLSKSNSNEIDLNTFANNAVNLIKLEYIEKQKRVVNEFQKKCKILKQQEQIQFEMVKQTEEKLALLQAGLRSNLKRRFEDLNVRQQNLERMLEINLSKLLSKQQMPTNESEVKMNTELREMKSNLKGLSGQINDIKTYYHLNEKAIQAEKAEKVELSADNKEIGQIRLLIKNESEKIKELIQKVKLLHQSLEPKFS